MKTVINAWSREAIDIRTGEKASPGLGDLIMGSLCLLNFCRKNNYNYIVDTHLHPISPFLKNTRTEYSDYIDSMKDEIKFFNHFYGIEEYIQNSKDEIIVLHTNEFYRENVPDDYKEFIQHVMEPTDDIVNDINETMKLLPENFSVLHFRLGDRILIDHYVDKDLPFYLEMARKHQEENMIIMSDFHNFKKIVNQHLGMAFIDTLCAHYGVHNDYDILRATIVEFYILTKSTKIVSHSVYTWNSGFVTMASKCYNIPIKYIT
jgi:hypothetical protein